MGPLLFYFTPKGFSEDTAKSLILYQKWQTDLSSNLNSDLLTVSVSSAMLRRIETLRRKDTDRLVRSGTGVGTGWRYTLVQVFVIPVTYHLALSINGHRVDSSQNAPQVGKCLLHPFTQPGHAETLNRAAELPILL